MSQLKLKLEGEKVPPRPTYQNSSKIKEELAVITGNILFNWYQTVSLEECIEDAKKIITNYTDFDGFALAEKFKRLGYVLDASIVRDLDVVYSECNNLVQKKVKEWVQEYELKLTLQIDSRVPFDRFVNRLHLFHADSGIVKKLMPETYQYVIRVEVEHIDKNFIINAEDII